MDELFSVVGKTALITGGSSGIGLMIAEGLLAAGAQVWICSRSQENVDTAVAQLSAFGQVRGFAVDLGKPGGAEAAAAALADAPLHILVNNAGSTWGAPIESFPRVGFDKVLALNVTAPFEMIRTLLPALRAAALPGDPARVINIASTAGLVLAPWEAYSYSASKAGVIHMSRHIGRTLAKDNISVNVIAPGFFPSRMTAGVVDFEDDDEVASYSSPLGDRMGTIEDIVGAVIYLSSRAGAWLTGITIPVAGGVATID